MDNGDRTKRLKALRDAWKKKEGITTEEVVVIPQKVEVVKEVVEEPQAEEVLNIAPKKPTWDLERGLEKQMAKLERRTQNAIVEILREKMEREMQEDSDEDEEDD